ncbi:putative RNA-directed DNA polymerase [Tanacetum coccineum]|uniref:beta-ketoacyl-[acyl-carrier-protein] synthase I n=1 Tax=Tanacetum coccineum TaxID=301880 RepID=A0ABQ5HPJ3_9ASTR
MPNMGSALLDIDLGFSGPNYSILAACTSSNYCFYAAASHIREGKADLMIVGGVEASIIPIIMGGFAACRALSRRNDDLRSASRPWDKDRDGFVMGEGAGVLVMERGSSQIYLATKSYCKVNYINAHATSTQVGDLAELLDIERKVLTVGILILRPGSSFSYLGKMEDLLYVKDYYLPIFTTEKPENKTDAEWTILHRQVCQYIRQWVDDNVLTHIYEETHARTLWNKLEQLYARKTGNNKLFLIKQMMRLKYTDGSPITDYLNAFQGIINQLADGVITMELAKGSILNEEMRRKSQGSSSQLDVLVTERQGRSQNRGPSNRGNHCSSSSKGKFADVECYHCHKKGHTMKFCRQLKKENKKKNYNNQKNKHKKDDDGDDNTEVNTTTDEFFVCYDYDMVNLANDDSSWILDSGATCHVATRKDYYSSYTPGDFGVVRMGNTGLSRIAGIGDICLKFDTGMELVLHNVKHVPYMRLNIISTGLLEEDGYHNSSGKRLWKVTLGSLIVARGKRESKL